MAYYLVRARLKPGVYEELREKVAQRAFITLRPFGLAISESLEGARLDPETGEAVWEEEDYCHPPLAMERAAVLDTFFDDLQVEHVTQGEGWDLIDRLCSFWESKP